MEKKQLKQRFASQCSFEERTERATISSKNMQNGTRANCSDPEAQFQYQLFPAVYILAFVVGFPSNLAALYVFILQVSPRTAFSTYISNLALADLVILCTLPFRIHYHLNRNVWVFGDFTCLITGVLFHANIYMSMCFMTCICVDRYMATVHPHKCLRSSRYSLVVSLLLWCMCGVAILVFILMGPLKSDSYGSCFEKFVDEEWSVRLKVYSIVGLIFCSLLPSAVILVCYPLVAKRISMIGTRTAQKAQRVIYTILAITVLCFLPNHLVYLLHVLQRLSVIQDCSAHKHIYVARRITVALVTLNTCLDPMLYYMTTSHFKWEPLKRTWLWGVVSGGRGVYTITH